MTGGVQSFAETPHFGGTGQEAVNQEYGRGEFPGLFEEKPVGIGGLRLLRINILVTLTLKLFTVPVVGENLVVETIVSQATRIDFVGKSHRFIDAAADMR